MDKRFAHQTASFEATKDLEAWGIFWEQGSGKTRPMIDLAQYLFEEGRIDAVLVVAPPGVHRNWINDEIPKWMPDEVDCSCLFYESNLADRKWFKGEADALIKYPGLAFLAMSYHGFMTDAGKKFAKRFLTKRRCLYILDESHHIKTPGIKRTKTIVAYDTSAALEPEYTYDEAGLQATVEDNDGKVTTYAYDRLDRLTKTTFAGAAAGRA